MVRFKQRYLVASIEADPEQRAGLGVKDIFAALKVRDETSTLLFVDRECTRDILRAHVLTPKFHFRTSWPYKKQELQRNDVLSIWALSNQISPCKPF